MGVLERFKKQPRTFSVALAFTLFLLISGYFSFGPWTTFIFSFGFMGGFILWVYSSTEVPFSDIKKQYWLTLSLFVVHRVEENLFRFQDELAKLTGIPVPEISSPFLIFLVLVSVGGWLLAPYFIKIKSQFGYYFAWSFIASMGITELAHFVLPLFVSGHYSYFPGMASVLLLAPVAWWGMYRLSGWQSKG